MPTNNTDPESGQTGQIIRKAVNAHLTVIYAMAAPTLALVLLPFFPLNLTACWVWFYEGLRLYYLWPLLVALVSVCYLLVGQWFNSWLGYPTYSRILATILAIVAFVMSMILVWRWSLEWSPAWLLICVVPLALAAVAGTAGHMAFAESWRKRNNGAVVRTILGGVSGAPWPTAKSRARSAHSIWFFLTPFQLFGRSSKLFLLTVTILLLFHGLFDVEYGFSFLNTMIVLIGAAVLSALLALAIIFPAWLGVSDDQSGQDRGFTGLVNPRMGSYHRLAVLSCYYKFWLATVMVNGQVSNLPPFFQAGDALVDYLQMVWPKQKPRDSTLSRAPSSADEWRLEILLQMLSVALWRVRQSRVNSAQGSSAGDRVVARLPQEITRWRDLVKEILGEPRRPYLNLLDQLIRMGRNAQNRNHVEYPSVVPPIVDAFRALPEKSSGNGRSGFDLRETCAQMWLVAAPGSFLPEAIIDAWRKIREKQDLPLYLDGAGNQQLNPVTAYAATRLHELTERRLGSLPLAERSGLEDISTVLEETRVQLGKLAADTVKELGE